MIKFKEFMTNNDKIYKKLHVYDFDDTLVFSPYPEEGKKIFEDKMGEWKWGNAWWYRPESLSPPVMPNPAPINRLNQEVVKEAYDAIRDPNTYVVVLTGRPISLYKEVRRVLSDYAIKPDELILTPFGEKTIYFKLNTINRLVHRFPNLEEVKVFDDKGAKRNKYMNEENHIKSFRNLLERIKINKESENPESNFKYKIVEVVPPAVAALELTNEKLTPN